MFKKTQKNLVLTDKQTEIIQWLIAHKQETALSTWKMLFNERDAKQPDVCIAYYDGLNPYQKADVELIVAKYFNLLVKGIRRDYKDLLYIEK